MVQGVPLGVRSVSAGRRESPLGRSPSLCLYCLFGIISVMLTPCPGALHHHLGTKPPQAHQPLCHSPGGHWSPPPSGALTALSCQVVYIVLLLHRLSCSLVDFGVGQAPPGIPNSALHVAAFPRRFQVGREVGLTPIPGSCPLPGGHRLQRRPFGITAGRPLPNSGLRPLSLSQPPAAQRGPVLRGSPQAWAFPRAPDGRAHCRSSLFSLRPRHQRPDPIQASGRLAQPTTPIPRRLASPRKIPAPAEGWAAGSFPRLLGRLSPEPRLRVGMGATQLQEHSPRSPPLPQHWSARG
ncbi:hypothetical protein NDU88_005370 [Pleurodeles waltl]|uniref:Uncharacterized protein n=1 Tax=Pleurodeles waltl TaxID=8319 RepID=A0AAV7TVB8_PLEWA|nr:hypothetical protein NDU88_005370 [Pleurodeles waltl]